MTSVYISSTFNDLKDFREAVTRALRKSGIQVIAMEDYVASDSRPLERCLQDVRNSDIYIGLFAHRYGFVPAEKNPQNRSITELEYRQAQQEKKPCLIFLLDESAPWIPKFMDSNTGDGEAGRKVRELRAELGNERLASFFRGPDDLAALATAAVARHEAEQRQATVAPTLVAPQVEAPQARELHSHLFLTYLESDAPVAQAISTQLQYRNRSVLSLASAMLAASPAELASLENSLRQCHAAAVVLSAGTLARMQEQGRRSAQLLAALKERTGSLIALCRDAEAMAQAQNLGATHVLDLTGWQPGSDLPLTFLDEIDRILSTQLNQGTGHVVGLPFVVIAMQKQEASDLVNNPAMVTDQASNQALRQLLELRSEGAARATPPVAEQLSLVSQLVGRYAERREEWHPFGLNGQTIGGLIREIVDNLNNAHHPRLKGRFIKVQHYSFDPIMDRDNPFHGVYRELVQGGCILIVDELSLLHPGISEALLRFPFFATEQVSVVSVSPLNPYGSGLFVQLESRLSERLALAHYRFERDYDPKCELSVGDDRRLKRWLYSSLPTVLQDLREPVPDSGKLRIFAQELGREIDHRMASEYYTKGAGL